VLGRMVDGAVIRTFAQQDVVDFAHYSGLPTINALTDDEHPCQIIADLQTIVEQFGTWKGKRVCFLGDGDRTWPAPGFGRQHGLGLSWLSAHRRPSNLPRSFMQSVPGSSVTVEVDAAKAVAGCDVVYTDVWVSMGKEAESAERIEILRPDQINESLMSHANNGAIIMHRLPRIEARRSPTRSWSSTRRSSLTKPRTDCMRRRR